MDRTKATVFVEKLDKNPCDDLDNSPGAAEIRAIQQGDKAAFARLFSANRTKLLALAYRLTSSSVDAEDVVQDAFVSSWRNHHQYQGQAQASTWLYRVTFNAALMHLRSRRRKGASSADALPADVLESFMARAPNAPAPLEMDQHVDAQLAKKPLSSAVHDLKDVDQLIVHMRFVDELSTEEVSTRVGLSPAAVKTRLHRARATLRDAASLQAFV
jgi:RNA polymerase sigma-70 factor, ECF subfamily